VNIDKNMDTDKNKTQSQEHGHTVTKDMNVDMVIDTDVYMDIEIRPVNLQITKFQAVLEREAIS
jgi:hypothetical protein